MKEYMVKYKTKVNETVSIDFDTYEECLNYVYCLAGEDRVNVDEIKIYTSSKNFDNEEFKESYRLVDEIYTLYLEEKESASSMLNMKELLPIDFKKAIDFLKSIDYFVGFGTDNRGKNSIGLGHNDSDLVSFFNVEDFVERVIDRMLEYYCCQDRYIEEDMVNTVITFIALRNFSSKDKGVKDSTAMIKINGKYFLCFVSPIPFPIDVNAIEKRFDEKAEKEK